MQFDLRRELRFGHVNLSASDRDPSFEIFVGHRLKGQDVHFIRCTAFFNRVDIEHEALVEFFVGWVNEAMSDEHVVRR